MIKGMVMKSLYLSGLCLLISACAVGYQPRYYYSDIVVANLTGDTIRNVKVQVGPGGRTLECAEVTKNRLCQQRFAKRLYPLALVELTWQTSAGQQMSSQMNPSVPVTMVPSLSLRLMMDIGEDGTVKYYFKQDDLYYGALPQALG